ncbi:uncharacterized protein G2W53_036495 [Senna tora]|uniref:Uncharacterized protein n=1 Tax=Senna tora TaxID=362788 RepID=A0A834W555_9FABA|nr:uncharacterized protein G2W53_036495 [Senna tora]
MGGVGVWQEKGVGKGECIAVADIALKVKSWLLEECGYPNTSQTQVPTILT